MKNKIFDLTMRASDEELDIDDQLYLLALFKATYLLYQDFQELMKKENRNFGIVLSYFNSINQAFSGVLNSPDEFDLTGRVMYLLKPIFRTEFSRLCKKKLSPADSAICIIRKITLIIVEKKDFVYIKEIKTVNKIIEKLYTNIKTYGKKDPLFFMGDLIRRCTRDKILGKYTSNIFKFNTESTEKELYTGDSIKFIAEEKNKILELDL